jgi:hypothetical protein
MVRTFSDLQALSPISAEQTATAIKEKRIVFIMGISFPRDRRSNIIRPWRDFATTKIPHVEAQ